MLRTILAGLSLVLLSGCANPAATAESAGRLVRVALDQARPKPFSAASNLALTEEEARFRAVLSESEQEEALAALRDLSTGQEVTQELRPASLGIRWSDVPLAARYAGEEVEMAIARRVHTEDEMRFILTTVDGRPAELVVTRTHDERVYEASTTVGRFGTDVDRAARLLAALDRNLRLLGRKRSFE